MPSRSLKDGTITLLDGAATPASVTVDVEDGDLSWTERTPVDIVVDRGVLAHARASNEQPVEIAFSMIFQSLSTHATLTPYDALKNSGGASAWTSDEPNSDAWAVTLQFVIGDPAGGASETITFARFCPEEIVFQEGTPYDTLRVSGRAVITAPAVT